MLAAFAVLAVAVLVSSAAAQPPNCTNGRLDAFESDVDCGGVCGPCEERKTCAVDDDCDVAGGSGCAGTKCFDMNTAQTSITIFQFYFGATFILLCLYAIAHVRSKATTKYRAYKRGNKKAAAEIRRAEKALATNAATVELRERNRHNAVMQAYVDKVESAASGDESSEEESSYEAVVYKKPHRFRNLVSGMMGTSTTKLSAPSTADVEEAEVVPVKMVKKKKKKKPQKVRVVVVTHSPEEEAIRLRRVFLARLKALALKSKQHVGQMRKDAAIVNLTAQVLASERNTTVSKMRVLALTLVKIGTLVNMSEAEVETAVTETERAEEIVAGVLSNKDGADKQAEDMLTAVTVLDEVAETVGSPVETDYFCNATEVMDWELGDPELNKLSHLVESELETNSKRKQDLDERVMLATTSFVSSINVTDVAQRNNCCSRWLFILWGLILPKIFLIYPAFYFAFFAGMGFVGFPMFTQIRVVESNLDMQNSGLLGETFLPVPGYYNLEGRPEQRFWVPIIYTVMHCALYCFCWLPVPFYRGIWRDVSLKFPSTRKYIPIDDMVFFHKLLALFILSFLFTGAGIWLYVLYKPCLDGDARSCQAFDPLPPPNFPDPNNTFVWNPFFNVLMLRKMVYTLWFPILPLIHWVGGPPPRFLPSFWRRYYYEIAYYGHVLIAMSSLVIALICRFDVFYPALLPWGIYLLDSAREIVLRTFQTTIVVRPMLVSQEDDEDQLTSRINTDLKGIPTSMRLLITVPAGFKINAGQFVYLKVPTISGIQWHPFSLASGSNDTHVELHVGVIGSKDQWKKNKDGDWVEFKRPTFTFKLQQLLRSRILQMAYLDDPERQADEVKPIRCQLRGPYGSTFTKCFDPHYSGAIIIGAGTGLTAALSVLREFLIRKARGDRVPKYCWFIWSCTRVEDLFWVWDLLITLILENVKKDVIKPGKKWSRNANMLGWLGITIYVTRCDKAVLKDFLSRPIVGGHNNLKRDKKEPKRITAEEEDAMKLMKAPIRKVGQGRTAQFAKLRDLWTSTNTNIRQNALTLEVHNWLGHERRLLPASMDDKRTHIKKLLAWCRVYLDRKSGRASRLAVAFCGPPGLAHTISSASRSIGSGMEFSADHQ